MTRARRRYTMLTRCAICRTSTSHSSYIRLYLYVMYDVRNHLMTPTSWECTRRAIEYQPFSRQFNNTSNCNIYTHEIPHSTNTRAGIYFHLKSCCMLSFDSQIRTSDDSYTYPTCLSQFSILTTMYLYT